MLLACPDRASAARDRRPPPSPCRWLADWCAIDLVDEDGAPRRAALHHGDPALADQARASRARILRARRGRGAAGRAPAAVAGGARRRAGRGRLRRAPGRRAARVGAESTLVSSGCRTGSTRRRSALAGDLARRCAGGDRATPPSAAGRRPRRRGRVPRAARRPRGRRPRTRVEREASSRRVAGAEPRRVERRLGRVAPAVVQAVHGVGALAEALGDLAGREAREVAQQEHGPLLVGQRAQRERSAPRRSRCGASVRARGGAAAVVRPRSSARDGAGATRRARRCARPRNSQDANRRAALLVAAGSTGAAGRRRSA